MEKDVVVSEALERIRRLHVEIELVQQCIANFRTRADYTPRSVDTHWRPSRKAEKEMQISGC